jgi:polyisoprenyl-teichoic acid--peptidoglycan teichoic acid transferase
VPTPWHRASLSSIAVAASLNDNPPAGQAPARSPLDMELPGADSRPRLHLRLRAKWPRLRRTLAVAVVLVVTLGGLLVSQSYMKLHEVFRGGAGSAAALKENVDPNLLKGEGTGRVNILLMGRGGGNHDGPDLTDSMMLVSIDPVNHTSTLLSLPRDLWVNVPSAGNMKLNAVWESGEFQYLGKIAPGSTNPKAITAGFNMVDQTIHQVLGVDVSYNALVDFQAFQQAVDTVGGINVNVPADLVDPTMAWENGNDPVLAKAGPDSFNGKQALIYVRSRETSSDFARADRQRAVLLALKGKVETLGTLSNPLKLAGLMNAFGNNVATDLSLKNAQRLYTIVKAIKGTNITSVDLDGNNQPTGNQYVTTANINGQSVVEPKAGLFQYNDIQQYVRGQLKDPYILKEHAKIEILNGTLVPGLASKMQADLQSYGYDVTSVGNTPNGSWVQTTLVSLSGSKDKYTKHYLEQRFNTTAADTLSDKTIPTNGADFVIIIGNDEVSSSPAASAPAN